MTLYVGTSGWAYPEWRPEFYPQDVPRSRWLSHYATKLSSCEINATFYKNQERSVLQAWAGQVPSGFRFAVKAHRALTYVKSIAPDGRRLELLRDFLAQADGLGESWGPVLFQVPAYRKPDLDALEALLGTLPLGLRFAFEFRETSWLETRAIDAVTERGGTICVSDVVGTSPHSLPPGDIAYVRLRAARYPNEKRAAWRALLQREAATRDVYAFTKHESTEVGDPYGGVGLAAWLHRYARQPARGRGEDRSSSNQTDVA